MTILVTGAAGFIGRAVAAALLDRGETVIGLDSLNSYYDPALKHARLATLASDRFTVHHADIADMAALDRIAGGAGITRIVHLAAQAGVRHSIDNPHAYARANLVGHLDMLELARRLKPAHVVYASSSSVYGDASPDRSGVDEPAVHPISLYAATKRADELMSEAYAHLYAVPLTGLRFFTVYGPWGRPDMAMWLFAKAILGGRPIDVFGEGDMRRDFTYIDDIVSGVVACLDHPAPDDGEVKAGGSVSPHRLYNIGNSRSEDLGEMIALIEAACGRKAERRLLPMQPGDVRDTFADISAIGRDLGFAPTTTIAEGVPRFVAWYRDYHGV